MEDLDPRDVAGQVKVFADALPKERGEEILAFTKRCLLVFQESTWRGTQPVNFRHCGWMVAKKCLSFGCLRSISSGNLLSQRKEQCPVLSQER